MAGAAVAVMVEIAPLVDASYHRRKTRDREVSSVSVLPDCSSRRKIILLEGEKLQLRNPPHAQELLSSKK